MLARVNAGPRPRQAQRVPARGGARLQLGDVPARGGAELADARRGHRDHGHPRARPGDLPHRRRARGRPGGTADGPRRADAGDPRRLRRRRDRLRRRRGRLRACRRPTLVAIGLALVGASGAIVQLSRAAAAEMFPPERRARGMSFVLFGAVSGAIWGPLLFGPLFAHRALDRARARRAVAARHPVHGRRVRHRRRCVRPDPKEIAAHATRAERDDSGRAGAARARSSAGRACSRRWSPPSRASR